jgi:hypothetical protein
MISLDEVLLDFKGDVAIMRNGCNALGFMAILIPQMTWSGLASRFCIH